MLMIMKQKLRNPFAAKMATAIEEVSRQRRVAQERKKIHDSSEHIYPKSEKTSLSGFHIPRKQNIGSFGTTSYSIDFAKKEGKPALPRPCSVTRRNRPHPSQVATFLIIFGYHMENSIPTSIFEIEICILFLSVTPMFYLYSCHQNHSLEIHSAARVDK